MNLDRVDVELLDDLLGDSETRRSLEISSVRKTEIEFKLPDTPDYDNADVVAELERAELQDLLCGVIGERPTGDLGANEFRKGATVTGGEINPRTGRRWGTTGFSPEQRRAYCAKFR